MGRSEAHRIEEADQYTQCKTGHNLQRSVTDHLFQVHILQEGIVFLGHFDPLLQHLVQHLGLLAGLAFGTLKYFFAEGFAVSWASIVFDYSIAYAAVGLAGLLRARNNDYSKLPLAALIGCVGRFVIHFISGVTVYAQYMPEEFMGMTMTSPVFYSVLYNGTYMLPNTILAIVICALLMKPAAKLPSAE